MTNKTYEQRLAELEQLVETLWAEREQRKQAEQEQSERTA